MNLELTTPPAEQPLTLVEAKQHLRVEGDDDDSYIEAVIAAATAQLDGRRGVLGRALMTQTWLLRRDAFPPGRLPIKLPFPPLQSVDSIEYVDGAGDLQAMPPADYQADPNAFVGRVLLAYGAAWPTARAEALAVRVTFTAGYGDATALAENAANLLHALKLMVGDAYRNRETVAVGDSANEIPMSMAVENLIGPYKTGFFA